MKKPQGPTTIANEVSDIDLQVSLKTLETINLYTHIHQVCNSQLKNYWNSLYFYKRVLNNTWLPQR